MVGLLIYAFLVAAAATCTIALSSLLGRPRRNRHKDIPYESGIVPTGEARIRMAIPYYLVAIFFIMFDVEAVFLYPWAVRLHELGWSGFLRALFFVAMLLVGLLYIWLRGGLVWRHLSISGSEKTSSSRN